MLIQRIIQPGLAHFSYLIGEEGEFVVIDPCANLTPYLEALQQEGGVLRYILETHRNEDILSGARLLSEKTGAVIKRSAYDDLTYETGERMSESDVISIGKIEIRGLHTPGHTKGHICYVLNYDGTDLALFSGDCLFYGDVGRTDFYPEEVTEMTEALYDSIHQKLLPLGDHVVLYPAHGAGSACGAQIEDREISTLGYERLHHPLLKLSKKQFVDKLAKPHYLPAYFRKMERLNLLGGLDYLPQPIVPVMAVEGIVVDVREASAFIRSHRFGTRHVPVESLGTYLPWVIGLDENFTLQASGDELAIVSETLHLMGYDKCHGYVTELGESTCSAEEIDRETFDTRFEHKGKQGLDVRKPDEVDEKLKGWTYLPLQELNDRMNELDKQLHYLVVCDSGRRSLIALSLLLANGYQGSSLAGGFQSLEK